MRDRDVMTCHAGAGHEPSSDRGAWGWLCEGCWARCLKILDRIRGNFTGASGV